MKKALYFVILILVIVLSIGIYLGVSVINSPEYALMQIADDVKASGIDGLMPHLTEDAQGVVDAVASISESKLFNSVMSILGEKNYAGMLKSNLKEIEWNLEDVLKGDKKADVILAFDYEDKLVGTIEINMLQDDGWKISGIELPEFDKVDL